MPNDVNRQIQLAARPEGAPVDSDFKLVEAPIPEAGDGEVQCRTLYLSLDPYMRGRMNAAKSYAKAVEIGEVMEGGAVSQVIESKHDGFTAGDIVFAYSGWQDYWVSGGEGLRKVDPANGADLHRPRRARHAGHDRLHRPRQHRPACGGRDPGGRRGLRRRRLGWSARSARSRAAASSALPAGREKCAFVTDELGFDACLDHRADDFAEQLAAACPDGVDVYWENVGGRVFEAVLPLFNPFARVPVCGLIAHYNATALPEGPQQGCRC